MTRLATSERTELCDLALQVGEDQPTVCEGWSVKDLVVHLLLREGSPASVGIVVPPLAGLAEAASRRIGRRSFPVLVERLRNGPPRLSPFAIRALDDAVNTMEFFVHLEDIRRAQPSWEPRELGSETERIIWSRLATPGRMLVRTAPVGVTIESVPHGSTRVLKAGTPAVTVAGPPSELALYLFGRGEHARVDLRGDDDAVARLQGASLGM